MADMYESQGQGAEASPAEAAVNDKRARFDALPSLEVSSEEVRTLGHGEGFLQRAINWLANKGVFGEYYNADVGWNISLNRTSARNVVSHSAGEGKVALLEHTPDLIKNGIFLETTMGDDGKISHIFAAKATIDGVQYMVGFVVRETEFGMRYYDHAIRFENRGRAETRAHKSDTAVPILPESPNSISNILKKHLKVNSDVKNVYEPPQIAEKIKNNRI
ncbi:MAG: hypothetical protein LBC59_07015 [Chitinispirillales bacterium]|jgi:hypothetical protein|nr:hypothetical protein [Chitinispirillales bacterium]